MGTQSGTYARSWTVNRHLLCVPLLDGSFGYQDEPYGPARCGQNQEAQVPKIRATGLRQYPLIDCHAGIDAVRLMMATKTSRATFITAAVSKMKEQGFDGYNLDIELGGTPADAVLYTDFVNEFSDALHAEGGALSSDVGSCGGRDYIGMILFRSYQLCVCVCVYDIDPFLPLFAGAMTTGLPSVCFVHTHTCTHTTAH